MHEGVLGADLSAAQPAGIEHAAQAVRALLARQGNRARQPSILGGFSQGAMVAAQVAFLSNEPLRALVLLSGTVVDETAWKANYGRRKGCTSSSRTAGRIQPCPSTPRTACAARWRPPGWS